MPPWAEARTKKCHSRGWRKEVQRKRGWEVGGVEMGWNRVTSNTASCKGAWSCGPPWLEPHCEPYGSPPPHLLAAAVKLPQDSSAPTQILLRGQHLRSSFLRIQKALSLRWRLWLDPSCLSRWGSRAHCRYFYSVSKDGLQSILE